MDAYILINAASCLLGAVALVICYYAAAWV